MPSETTLSGLRGILGSYRFKGMVGLGFFVFMVAVAAACSGSSSAPPVSVTPSGVGAGAHVGGWITSTYTTAEAHKEVDQYFGTTTELPRDVPPGLALKAIWMSLPPGESRLRFEVYDYYPKDLVPPTGAGQSAPESDEHIQVQAANSAGTIGNQTTPLDLGLPGYTAEVGVLSPAERSAAGNGTAGLYFVTGHGRQWTVRVWPASPPSQADLMAFLKGIPPQ